MSPENARTAFLELVEEFEANCGPNQRSWFYRNCIGIGVDWNEELAVAWISSNRVVYGQMISNLFVHGGARADVIRRLLRMEFRQLDQVIFSAITALGSVSNLVKSDDPSCVAELLIELAPIAKSNANNREHWRSILADLERIGDALAWQVVTEVSDKL